MQLNSDYYDTDFKFEYKGNQILIRNDGPEGESLFVNGVLQDQNFSAHNGQLIGHIFDEEKRKEVIEVILGGRETQDCMIYANGSLIHAHVTPEETAAPPEQETVSGKKRNGSFFAFIVILLLAICTVIFLPYLNNAGEKSEPADAAAQEETGSVPASATAGGLENTGAPEQYIDVDYTWNYGKDNWAYKIRIPESTYNDYKTVDRTKIKNYGYYVTDPTDDEYLAGLAEKFKEAADEGNYSDLDMVKNIIFFVQSLDYVDDKVGTGYDEYPKFPLETLADQGGDCEDSAILLASLLRELGYDTVLLQFKDHMAVGVKGEASIQGSYFEEGGNRYYYVETTSPGWEIGEAPAQIANQPAKILHLNQ